MAEPVAQAAVVDPGDDASYRGNGRPDADELRRQIDAISLSQALLDFEVANARVLDLTARLVDASRQVGDLQKASDDLRAELQGARDEIERLEKRHRRLVASTSYRWANRLWTIRKALTKG